MTRKLDWVDRPASLKRAIHKAYVNIMDDSSSKWGMHNGSPYYSLAGIDDELMIEKLILDRTHQGQTEFIFMDIGAGDFQWGKNVAKFINNHPIFQDKIKVDIYSLRGEHNSDLPIKEEGICKLYEYGQFQVENLIDQLKSREHDLSCRVDLIVSSWCFRHLVDPAGTLLQAYELLKVDSGMIFVDGFLLLLSTNDNIDTEDYESNIINLFASFKAPFFMMYDDNGRRLNVFVMQKSTKCCDIPVTYQDVATCGDKWQIGSHYITVFNSDFEEIKLNRTIIGNRCYFTNSMESESLLNTIILDCDDIKLAKYTKIIELFVEQIKINDIHRLLKDLIELDEDEALRCIKELLLSNNNFAFEVLNYIPDNDKTLLRICADYKLNHDRSIINPLFKELLKIATPEVLNYRRSASANTLLMDVIVFSQLELAEELLLLSNVEATIKSLPDSKWDIEEKTAFGFCEQKINKKLKEIEYAEKTIRIIVQSNDLTKQDYLEKKISDKFELLIQFDQLKKFALLVDSKTTLQEEATKLCRTQPLLQS